MGKHDAVILSDLLRRKVLLVKELECLFPPKSDHVRKMRHAMLDELADVEQRIRITEYNMETPK